jgi:hypothetical protein
VRYIHLNPLRSSLVSNPADLDAYPFTGHSCLMRKIERPWQDTEAVWIRFGRRVGDAVVRYGEYIREGAGQGRRPDLEGQFIRAPTAIRRGRTALTGREAFGSDDRILGSERFVASVRGGRDAADSETPFEGDPEVLGRRIAQELGVSWESVKGGRKSAGAIRARALLAYTWIRCLGRSGRSLVGLVSVSAQALHQASARVEARCGPVEEDLRRWLGPA